MGIIRVGGYPMDLAMTEEHSFPGEATEYPVEQGADISDHIRELPPEITLECIVSDTPSGLIAGDPTRRDLADNPLTEEDLLASRQGLSPPVPLPSADALSKLREMKALGKPITVETSLGAFASMAFIDLTVPRDKDKNNGLFFTAKFKKVTIVSNKRTRTRVRSNMANGSGTANKAGKPLPIYDKLKWYHGTPPGSPWRSPNPITLVTVRYNKPTGVPDNQMKTYLGEIFRYEQLGYINKTIVFTQGIDNVEITGDQLAALIKDLQRDRRDMDAAHERDLVRQNNAGDPRRGPDGKLLPSGRKALPPGVDSTRWTVPTGPGTDISTQPRELPSTVNDIPSGPRING